MWINETQNIVYTIVKTRAKKNLVSSFPNIEFTTNIEHSEPTSFPNVYIHFMPNAEMGGDLVGDEIHAFMCGVQIDVTVTDEMGEQDAETVTWEVVSQFKKLLFGINMMPEFIKTGNADIRRQTFRCRRVIAYNDIIGG